MMTEYDEIPKMMTEYEEIPKIITENFDDQTEPNLTNVEKMNTDVD